MNDTTKNSKQNTENSLNGNSVCSDVLASDSDKPIENTQNSDSQMKDNNITDNNTRVYNIQNLKMYGKDKPVLTPEEAKRRGRQGGIKSGEVRRQRKTMRESLLSMLEMQLTPEKLDEMGVDISTLNGDYTMQGALISAMLREAVNGSEKAMRLVRDTIGEAPTIKQEITETITQEDATLMNDLKKALIS